MKKETKELLEQELVTELKAIKTKSVNDEGHKTAMNNIKVLADVISNDEKIESDERDRAERRRIDEEKNKSLSKIESKKADVTFGKVSLEILKVAIPSVLSIVAYDIFQKRLLEFEEHGRLTTSAGKELHLPRFQK